jgi:hypothetical protein
VSNQHKDVSQEHLQWLAYQGDFPKSKTNEGMDEMLAVLQASSSDETAERAITLNIWNTLSSMSKATSQDH